MPEAPVLEPPDSIPKASSGRSALHEAAKERMLRLEGGGVLRADWLDVVFAHFEVDPAAVQAFTPFEIDLYHDRAFVSLVMFRMRRFRFRGTGLLGSLALAPLARHGFCNLRTYTSAGGEPAIVLMAEWINNRASVLLGPRIYRLPYRFGRIDFAHGVEDQSRHGRVCGTGGGAFAYRAVVDREGVLRPAEPGTLDEFLLERTTAFTAIGARRSMFRIWHEPWRQQRIDLEVADLSLFEKAAPYLRRARLVAAHYSPGLCDIWIGRPRPVPEGVACAGGSPL